MSNTCSPVRPSIRRAMLTPKVAPRWDKNLRDRPTDMLDRSVILGGTDKNKGRHPQRCTSDPAKDAPKWTVQNLRQSSINGYDALPLWHPGLLA